MKKLKLLIPLDLNVNKVKDVIKYVELNNIKYYYDWKWNNHTLECLLTIETENLADMVEVKLNILTD